MEDMHSRSNAIEDLLVFLESLPSVKLLGNASREDDKEILAERLR